MKRIGNLRETRVPKCPCPSCGHPSDAAMAADPANPDVKPKPDDVTICIECAQILVFTDDLMVRAARPGEIEMTPAIRRAQQAVRSLDRRAMRTGGVGGSRLGPIEEDGYSGSLVPPERARRIITRMVARPPKRKAP